MTSTPIRHTVLYGARVVRSFTDRPASVDAVLREGAARAGERTALVLGETRISYRDLDAQVEQVARNLVTRGLRPGDRLGLLLDNGIEFILAFMAAARAGIIAVPMNTRQRRPEIEFALNQCGAAGLIHDAAHAANLPAASATPALAHVFVVGGGQATPFDALLADAAPVTFAPIAEEDPLCLLYTSGTTGQPKGAVLTHVGTVHSMLHYRDTWRLKEGEIAALAVPASHVTGLVAIILTTFLVAGTVLVMPAFKARRFLELATRERMSYTLMVPAMYNLCLLDPDFTHFDLSAWRIAGFGGAPMPGATIARLAETLPGLSLCNAYGATETTSPCALLAPGEINDHPRAVGRVLPCADVIIMDDDGREVAPGESGELLIGGPMVVPRYWDNPEADATGFIGGYWRSGDIGSRDEHGFLHVFDRKKDMINRAGFKVYSIEVENTLCHHPSVTEAAVIGAPHPVLGEQVHAFVHCAGGRAAPDDLRAFCAERLSDYKVPETITFLPDPLPRNANGKILKTDLRAQLLAQLDSASTAPQSRQ
ncbi:MAG TPA: acyl--CoA ligase [Paracoccus sp.]|nr:acyl--CoA ligase [Paracoccus sp. (in: a-proteobacteria)]